MLNKLINSAAVILVLIVSFSCSSPEGFLIEDSSYLIYKGSRNVTIGDVNFQAKLKANLETNELLVLVEMTNEGNKSLSMDNFQGIIISKDGLRSNPIQIKKNVTTLSAGESITDTLIFKPINNAYIYKYTGLNGDLNAQYLFSPGEMMGLPFNDHQLILFQAELQPFEAYQKEYGLDKKVIIWQIDNENKQLGENITSSMEQAAALFLKSLQANDAYVTNELNYQLSSNEIMMGGLVISTMVYQIEEQVSIDIKVVNHQSLPLDIDTKTFVLKVGNDIFKPIEVIEKDFNPLRTKGQQDFVLRKGERIGYQLTFEVGAEEKYLDFLPNIGISGTEIKLLASIPLIQSVEPILEQVQEDQITH